MAIEFTCPACGATLRVGDDVPGRMVRCGGCLSVLRVPVPPPDDPNPYPPRRPAEPTRPDRRPGPARGEYEPDPTRRRPVFWLVIGFGILAAGLSACCCGIIALMPTPRWRDHESDQGGFKVELPGDPRTDVSVPGVKTGGQTRVVGTRLWGREEVYLVAYEDVVPPRKRMTDREHLDEAVRVLQTNPTLRVVRDQPVTVSGFPGREIEYTAGNGGTYVLRLVVAEGRVYRVVAGGKSVRSGNQDVRRFLNSFAITDPNLLAASAERTAGAGRAVAAAAFRVAAQELAAAAGQGLADLRAAGARVAAAVLAALRQARPEPQLPTAPAPRLKSDPVGILARPPHPALTFRPHL